MARPGAPFRLGSPVIVPPEVIELGNAATRIFAVIWYDSLPKGFTTITNRTLTKLTGITHSRVDAVLKLLKEKNIIQTYRLPYDKRVRVIRITPAYAKRVLFELLYATVFKLQSEKSSI